MEIHGVITDKAQHQPGDIVVAGCIKQHIVEVLKKSTTTSPIDVILVKAGLKDSGKRAGNDQSVILIEIVRTYPARVHALHNWG